MTEETHSQPKTTILLVDPDKETQKLLQTVSKRIGYTLVVETTVEEALNQMESELPELILAAYELPDRDGCVLREILLKDPQRAKVPFFLLANTEDIELRLKAIQLNIAHFLIKPLEVETLVAQIQSILSQKAAQEQLTEEEKMKTIKQLSVTMNHEIKNHLATILGNAELILLKYPELGPDIENKLNKIRKAGKSIKQVLDNLNLLSKITTTMYVSKVEMLLLAETKKNQEPPSQEF